MVQALRQQRRHALQRQALHVARITGSVSTMDSATTHPANCGDGTVVPTRLGHLQGVLPICAHTVSSYDVFV